RLRITDFNRETLSEQLQVGWIVERHLMDGDVVLMNRQPTLHKISILGHKVKLLPGRTFRINPSVCPPYNADFDGDEMNMHVPQGEEARAEGYFLLGVPYNFRSPRFGGVIIGGWRTQLSGSFLLTLKNTTLTRQETAQLLYESGVEATVPNKPLFTGKEVFSFLLPKDLSIRFPTKAGKSGKLTKVEGEVIIKNGKLISGVIDENAIGSFSGMLLDRIIQSYGQEYALAFMNQVTKLSLHYLTMRQISIGIDDLTVSSDTRKLINSEVRKQEKNVYNLIDKFKEGKLELWPGLTTEETLETEIINGLNKARDEAVNIVADSLKMPNAAVVMAISGARGKLLNVGLISGLVGQQAIGGGRPTRGYYSNRTFPHFERGDIGTKSKGFISGSYSTGLDPFEFFWVSASGREGLTDTGVKTPKSGYMYRRLSNALQDLKVSYDRTVRDAAGIIIQFKYGEDGIDVNKSDFGSINMKKLVEVLEDAPKKTK
ncbi:MAG: DNA-directed RNA polymerase subunit A', partial [Candidatus Altiarchaeota archaeon]|nr:DNA-directed RNA polymerase subunit A' [Candidatus Altiarchaeota archaeon]